MPMTPRSTDRPASPRARLTYVCAAPGTGKTTVLTALVAAAQGEVVLDNDELLEDGGLIGVPIATPSARETWPAYNRMWERITTIIRRAGHPVIMLTQVPDAVDLDRAADDPDVHWLGWDCPDDVRVDRLRRRGWRQDLIDDALLDAATCRRLLPDGVTTEAWHTPQQTAELIMRRIRPSGHR